LIYFRYQSNSEMTFNKEFLIKLQERLNGLDSYPMTKQSVEFLLNSKQLRDTDKYVIYDAIRNDVYRNDELLLIKQLWNENIVDSKLRF
jgi:hypothetical protein